MSTAEDDRPRDPSAPVVGPEEVARVVDAITGATWNTRNRIMADLFQEQLAKDADSLPAYRPPGC